MSPSKFAFDDSGAPAGVVEYTTLVIFHGCQFNKNTFQKFLPLAAKNDLRVVAVNRREYPGSMPYSDEEVRQIDSSDYTEHEKFFDDRAQEQAGFLAEFAEKESLPKARGHRAGLAVMGWSAGNVYALSLLSHASAIHEETRKRLEPFLRAIVMFETPGYVVGHVPNSSETFVLLDTTYTLQQRANIFSEWVSSYFEHPNVHSHQLKDLLLMPKAETQKPPSTSTMTEFEYRAVISPEAALKADAPTIVYPAEEYLRQAKQALFDDELAQRYWKGLTVFFIWGENSIWPCIHGKWGLEDDSKKYNEQGINGRPLKFAMMPGANHFPHWDEPESTLKFIADRLNGEYQRSAL